MSAAALFAAIALGLGPPPSSCERLTGMLASVPNTPVIAGNFRDSTGGCIVWLNVGYQWTRETACKAAMHEVGHLNGLPHSSDPMSVMFSPFRADPVPRGCHWSTPRGRTTRSRPAIPARR